MRPRKIRVYVDASKRTGELVVGLGVVMVAYPFGRRLLEASAFVLETSDNTTRLELLAMEWGLDLFERAGYSTDSLVVLCDNAGAVSKAARVRRPGHRLIRERIAGLEASGRVSYSTVSWVERGRNLAHSAAIAATRTPHARRVGATALLGEVSCHPN